MKNLFADIAFENFETAAYASLLIIAKTGGFTRAVHSLEVSLKEEQDISDWLKSNIESVTQRYNCRRALPRRD